MAVDAVRQPARADKAARAAKERREKIVLVVGVVVLLGLVAFEGPKTLKKLQGSHPAPAPAPTLTGAAATPTTPAVVHHPVDLAALHRFPAKDPFVQQLAAPAVSSGGPSWATPPHVRTSHFVAKDPFVQQLTVSPAVAPAAHGDKHASAPSTGGAYIVMLASVQVSRGRPAAAHAAAAARSHGIAKVGIVLSSSYPTLRSGFYAVYSGPYPTLGQAQQQLASIRGHGYVSAYMRRLAH